MKLFSGTANPLLTDQVARLLNIGVTMCEVVQFGNTELRVRITQQVTDDICVIIQSTSNPTNDHIMELLFIADGLQRGGAKEIHTIIPYFGYSRQHTQFRPGEAVSAHVVYKILKTVGVNSIVTIDPHNDLHEDKFPIGVLSAMPSLASTIKPSIQGEAIVVSPDEGGRGRAEIFAQSLFDTKNPPIAYVTKHRSKKQIHTVSAQELHGEVGGRTAIIVDDIITSGKTLAVAADLCRQHGATHVVAGATHADFIDTTIQTLNTSAIQHIFVTDTIETKHTSLPNNFTTISIAPLVASHLKNVL